MKQFKALKDITDTMTGTEKKIFDRLSEMKSWESFWKRSEGDMDSQKRSMKEIFKYLRKRQEVKLADVAKEVGCSKDLIYKIIHEKRHPSREMIIAICVAMRLSPGQTWALLHYTRYRELYVLDKREAIIAYGIMHQKNLEEINQNLKAEKLDPITPFKR